MFSCEFCEISHNTFFKEPFGRLLLYKHWFGLLSHHDLLFFQKRCHIYFPAKHFLGFIYRLATRVNSVFQTLSLTPTTQSNICDGTFFSEIVTVCNFQSMKTPVELNSLLFVIFNSWNLPWNWIAFYQNSFVISPGLLYHLIRCNYGRLAHKAFTSNPIVSLKQ